jgi:hypothetical protein
MQITNRLLFGIAAAVISAGTAFAAEDTLKPGKWEFVTDIQGPKPPPMPRGQKLPPGVEIRPDGSMHVTQSVCVSAKNPVPVGPPPQSPGGPGKPDCKIEKMERNGGDAHWAMTCNGPQGAMHAEGEAHYRGDTMQASTRSHVTAPNQPPADVTQNTTGRFLGACSGNEQGPPRAGQPVPPPPQGAPGGTRP